MNVPNQNLVVEIREKDLTSFKYFILTFALSQIGAIIAEMVVNSVIGTIVKYCGLILFLYGIFTLSTKYPHLNSSYKFIKLFIVAMVLDLGLAVFFYMYPLLNLTNSTSLSEFYIKVPKQYGLYLFTSIIIFIVIGILILSASYYLTEWSNLGFSTFLRTRTFLYYGIIFFIGQIVISIGLFQTGIVFQNIVSRSYIITKDVNAINSALLVINVGFFILFIALIVEIVACCVFYFRIHSFSNND